MAKYKANGYLLHEGKIVKIGEEVELTAEQAKRLGDKVKVSKVGENDDYNDFTVEELEEIAKDRNIEGYYDMRKAELVQALQESDEQQMNNQGSGNGQQQGQNQNQRSYNEYKVAELRNFARERNIEGFNDMRKDDLIQALQDNDRNNMNASNGTNVSNNANNMNTNNTRNNNNVGNNNTNVSNNDTNLNNNGGNVTNDGRTVQPSGNGGNVGGNGGNTGGSAGSGGSGGSGNA